MTTSQLKIENIPSSLETFYKFLPRQLIAILSASLKVLRGPLESNKEVDSLLLKREMLN